MAHPADTCAIRVVGRFRARWLSYVLLPQHAPLSTRDDVLFLVVDEASVDRFLQLQTTGLCDSAPTSAHCILGRPVRGATPKYEKSMNESSPSSATRSCSLVSSDSPEFTVDGASAGGYHAVSFCNVFTFFKGQTSSPRWCKGNADAPHPIQGFGLGAFSRCTSLILFYKCISCVLPVIPTHNPLSSTCKH